MIEYYIFYNKIIIVNCTVEKNISIKTVIDSSADINCISQKYIDELGIIYHDKSNSIETLDASLMMTRSIKAYLVNL